MFVWLRAQNLAKMFSSVRGSADSGCVVFCGGIASIVVAASVSWIFFASEFRCAATNALLNATSSAALELNALVADSMLLSSASLSLANFVARSVFILPRAMSL